MSEGTHILGAVTSGSLTAGLSARLAPGQSVEDVRMGKFVVVEGRTHRFFCLITDVQLAAANPQVLAEPPDPGDALTAEVLDGTATYGVAELAPMLMLPRAPGARAEPVKTVPVHFSPVAEAEEGDFALIFGKDDQTHFDLGCPVDMEGVPVCLDLPRLVERSNGVFGKSGTGKTFLTRLLLYGMIKKQQATCLVFDVHNEYGWQTESEDRRFVKGLKQVFPSRVRLFTMDEESTARRGVQPDHVVTIPYSAIEVEDVRLLADELRLNPTFAESAYLLVKRFGRTDWLKGLLATPPEDLKELADNVGASPESLNALHRKMEQVASLSFVKEKVTEDSVSRIMECLKKGYHVVLEFGRQKRRRLSYMLVANILTRRIYDQWVQQTEQFLAGGDKGSKPRPLVICVEEAHNFLSPGAARQTTFGDIAREMRKYSVTLLVVDQRPSGIDSEVMSQLGTRVTALLNDEADIAAVLTGVSGAGNLRSVLARLDSKQQALLLGHAVPMPMVIRTRDYESVYGDEQPTEESFDRMVKELGYSA